MNINKINNKIWERKKECKILIQNKVLEDSNISLAYCGESLYFEMTKISDVECVFITSNFKFTVYLNINRQEERQMIHHIASITPRCEANSITKGELLDVAKYISDMKEDLDVAEKILKSLQSNLGFIKEKIIALYKEEINEKANH